MEQRGREEGQFRSEILRVFNAADTDGNGYITVPEVRGLMTQLLGGREPTANEVELAVTQMDTNKDGVIQAEEFVDAMTAWLQVGVTAAHKSPSPSPNRLKRRSSSFGPEGLDPLMGSRKKLHEEISQFFKQFQARPDSSTLRAQILSHPSKTGLDIDLWRLGFVKCSQEEKVTLLQKQKDAKERYPELMLMLHSLDAAICLGAVTACRDALSMCEKFSESSERLDVAHELIEVFEMMTANPTQLGQEPAAHRLCTLLDPAWPIELQQMACDALFYFLLGPRIPHLREDNRWHPSHMYPKHFVMAQQLLVRVKEIVAVNGHGNEELLGQAIRLFGAFAEHNAEALDAVLSFGALPLVLSVLKNTVSPYLERQCTYTISVLCGHTHGGVTKQPSPDEILTILNCICPKLEGIRDEAVAANVILTLRYLLPICENIPFQLIQSLIELIGYAQWPTYQGGKFVVMSLLLCLKDIFVAHKADCVLAVNSAGLCERLSMQLDFGEDLQDITLCALLILEEMVHHELYEIVLHERFRFIHQLVHLVQNTKKLEVELQAMRVLWSLSQAPANFFRKMIEQNASKAFFAGISRFKQHDDILADAYGFLGPSFNFELVWLSTQCLMNIIRCGDTRKLIGQENCFLSIFTADEIEKVVQLHSIMCQELKKHRLSAMEDVEDLSNKLKELLQQIDLMYAKVTTSESAAIRQQLQEILPVWDIRLQEAAQSTNTSLSVEMGEPSPFAARSGIMVNLRIVPLQGDGVQQENDAKIIPVPVSATLSEVCNYLTAIHGTPVQLQYVHENQKVAITSQDVLSQLLSSGTTQRHVTIYVSPRTSIMPNGAPPIPLGPRELELRKLRAQGVTLSGNTLNEIYDYFKKLNVSSLNFHQFKEGMQPLGLNSTQVMEAFSAFDVNKDGSITLSELACGLAVIVDGTMEERLTYAFMAFDADGNNTLDANELTQLVMATTGYSVETASEVAQKVFERHDADRNGVLDFQEFKTAVMHNPTLLSSFWTNGIPGLSKSRVSGTSLCAANKPGRAVTFGNKGWQGYYEARPKSNSFI